MLYAVLLMAAILLCRTEKESLMLTLLVGMSYYLPTEHITDRHTWYAVCVLAELCVIATAFFLSVKASFTVIGICVMLVTGHILNYNHASGPIYYTIANYLEYLEIICCVIFSPETLNIIKTRIRYAICRNR